MNNLEVLEKRVQRCLALKKKKKAIDHLKKAKLRLKKFKALQRWKKGSFERMQVKLNTLTERKCKVCPNLLPQKKQKYCSNKCSYLANYKYERNKM